MSWRSELRAALRPIRRLASKVDGVMHQYMELYDSPCDSGCYECCHQMVTATLAEGVAIVDQLNELNPRATDFAKNAVPLFEKASAQFTSMAVDPKVTMESWFANRTRCVFLTEENRCLVYANRPITCRSYMVLEGSDCRTENAGAMVPTIDNRELIDASKSVGAEFSSRFRVPTGYAPLPAVMVWALTLYLYRRSGLLRKLKGTEFEDDVKAKEFWVRKLKLWEA